MSSQYNRFSSRGIIANCRRIGINRSVGNNFLKLTDQQRYNEAEHG